MEAVKATSLVASGPSRFASASSVLLSKAVRPMPDKEPAPTDIDTRFRQRYADLIVNDDATPTPPSRRGPGGRLYHGETAIDFYGRRWIGLGISALLLLISLSGLGLWLAKGHASLPWWLCVHLGSVMAFFATLPYGKMAHGFYRSAALVRDAVEKRQPNTLGLGSD